MNKNPFSLKFLLVGALLWNSPVLASFCGVDVILAMQVMFSLLGLSLFVISFNQKALSRIKNNEASIDEVNNACKIAGIVSIIGSFALFVW